MENYVDYYSKIMEKPAEFESRYGEHFTQLQSLLVNYTCGVHMQFLKTRSASTRTAGLIVNLYSTLHHILNGETDRIPKLLEEGQRFYEHVKVTGIDQRTPLFLLNHPAWGELERDERQRYALREFEEAAEALWIYGVLNGEPWA
jgi:hypothetical protein